MTCAPLTYADHKPCLRCLRKIAREHIRGFVLSPEQIAGLTGLLFLYNRFIADITVAVMRLKQGFDGAADATQNKFLP